MPKSYSLDLREKVVAYVEKTHDKRSASALFDIGIATIYRWINRKAKLGHLNAKQRPYAYKKICDEDLKAYVEAHPDHFLREIADHFNLCPSGVFRACKRLKITRKKRPRAILKGTKSSEKTLLQR